MIVIFSFIETARTVTLNSAVGRIRPIAVTWPNFGLTAGIREELSYFSAWHLRLFGHCCHSRDDQRQSAMCQGIVARYDRSQMVRRTFQALAQVIRKVNNGTIPIIGCVETRSPLYNEVLPDKLIATIEWV